MGKIYGTMWASFDSGIDTITCVHMLYISFVIFRSLKAPFSYRRELLIKHSHLVMAFIWVFGLSIWTIVTVSFGLLDSTNRVNYTPIYFQAILNFILWFIPLALIIVIAFNIIYILKQRSRIKSELQFTKVEKSTTVYINNIATIKKINYFLVEKRASLSPSVFNQKNAKLKPNNVQRAANRRLMNAHIKYVIIIGTFLAQWLPSCILAIVVPICNDCISNEVVSAFYWLTYTVCCTDAIMVLLLNSNVVFWRRYRNR